MLVFLDPFPSTDMLPEANIGICFTGKEMEHVSTLAAHAYGVTLAFAAFAGGLSQRSARSVPSQMPTCQLLPP